MAGERPEHPCCVHGGTAALLAVARPLRPGRAPAQHRRSSLRSSRTQRAQELAKKGKEGRVSARRSTPTRSGELRRAIAVARRLTTSVEHAQGLTAAMANTAVDLAWRTARNGAAAELGAGAAEGEGGGDRENGDAWGSGVASRPGQADRSQVAAATSPTYGRHVAGVRWRRAGRVRARGGVEARPPMRAGRKGGGSAQQCLPLSPFFFEFLFPKRA